MSQVISSLTDNPCGVLSGPSFAAEVAAGIPTAIVAAGTPPVAQAIQRAFSSPTMRIYTNEDVTGVELGGALKNVIAMAAGVVHGLDLGYNAGAALITRGIAEITRLAVACGGHRQTLAACRGWETWYSLAPDRSRATAWSGIELAKGRQLAGFSMR
jgi:glycerol-3-phosphate dehydrogenase (NAD(P)+)